MITFTVDELDQILKRRNPDLSDSISFANKRTVALKMALADFGKSYADQDSPFVRHDTFSEGTPPSTGAAKLNTGTGDWFKVTLLATARKIAGDVIYVALDASTYVQVPRMKPEDIVPSGASATVAGFNEVKGAINIYIKDGTITAPAIVHYYYYASLADMPLDPTSAIDIDEDDFSQLVDSVSNFIQAD